MSGVVIGMDPHKVSVTIEVRDEREVLLATGRFGTDTGGYKAIPAGGETMAWTIANGRPHPLIEAFDLGRFATGALVDEGAASGVAH